MIIIGEKINGSIPSVGAAIAARDAEFIKDLAKRQTAAGATFIDCCASVNENELETMKWLIDLIQEVTDLPIAVDSPDPQICVDAMPFCNKVGMINSVSGEGNKIDIVFPVIANTKWDVMALLCDDTGIPQTAEDRIKVLDHIMAKAKEFGIANNRIHIDPLIEMVCASEDGISMVVEVMQYIKKNYPGVHISGAISNISYMLPSRKTVNCAFAALAINAGMDSAVMDPCSRDLLGIIYATEALLAIDDGCLEYIAAYRDDKFGVQKK